MLESLVRVSRRVAYDHYASVRAEARSSVQAGRIAPPAIRRPERRYIPRAFDPPPKPTLARPRGSTPARMPAEPRRRVWSQALPFQQFHVLFNSLFKVLFIFRSLYLCAIGLWPVFSFRWNLQPILSSIPKLLDSSKERYRYLSISRIRGSHPLRRSVPGNLDQRYHQTILYKLQFGSKTRFQI